MAHTLTVRSRAEHLVVPEADPTEAALVLAAKRERSAFAPLYQRYVDAVYRYCYRCLGNQHTAEDATSLIFTKALTALASCHDAHFRSWLFSIAHNVIVDARRNQPLWEPLLAAEAVPDPAPSRSPEMQALADEDSRTIRCLLQHLPPDQRELLELRLSGLTDIEIARALGRSHGAVRTSQYRAIARLRAVAGVDAPRAKDAVA